GRSGRAKTNFFLHQLSIKESIFSIRFFKMLIYLLMYRCLFSLAYNGLAYGLWRFSKHLTIRLKQTLLRAESLEFTVSPAISYMQCYGLVLLI
ncbi:MAG: hypothetical protein K9G58_01320, partial [Bacteroidales bacterium]|nr:hypothetical protein [Bacteroidales bacterium]